MGQLVCLGGKEMPKVTKICDVWRKVSTWAYLKHACINIRIKTPGEEEECRARDLSERPWRAGLVSTVGNSLEAASALSAAPQHPCVAGGCCRGATFLFPTHAFLTQGLPEFLRGGNFIDGESRTELLLSNSSPLQRW